jgi:replicative DNA helicase
MLITVNIIKKEKRGLNKMKKRNEELERLIKEIDLLSLIEQDYSVKRVGKLYRVEPCPICGHKEHFTIYPETNSYTSFSECCKGGTVIDYLMEIKGLSSSEAIEALKNMNESGTAPKRKESSSQGSKEDKQKDFTNYINLLYKNTSEQDRQHFFNRGIPVELIERYKLSVGQDGKRDCLILPIWEQGKAVFYVSKFLDNGDYKNLSGSAPLFNAYDYLTDNNQDFIFITEGIFDALSLEAMGFKAIALGGVQHADKLKGLIEITPDASSKIFLTAFDNDDAGQECKSKFSYQAIEIPKEFNDINQWYVNSLQKAQEAHTDVLEIKEGITNQIEENKQPDSVSDYLDNGFESDVKNFLKYKDIKTGFDNLDLKMKGLYPGLYAIGAITSLGKTTFIIQLCDQLAEKGQHVIYFSLEQSKFEMVSKSIARNTAQINLNDAVSSVQIRSGESSLIVKEAIKNYKETAKNVSIIEGNFNVNVKTIRQYVEDYRKRNKVNPIVVIDYLQIMPAFDERMNDKQKIDTNVTELKQMSRANDLTVFVISSLNRGNYLAPVDFESFKESGGIEYTADVVWGLQLEVMNDPIFEKANNMIEKREKVKQAKNAEPREIELVCLKNRNGSPSFNCSFEYWARFDFFEPVMKGYEPVKKPEKRI